MRSPRTMACVCGRYARGAIPMLGLIASLWQPQCHRAHPTMLLGSSKYIKARGKTPLLLSPPIVIPFPPRRLPIMPTSTTDATRIAHSTRTPHIVRTTGTIGTGRSEGKAASVLDAIAKPFRQTPHIKEVYTPTSQYERQLSNEEETLVSRIHDYLSPTVLHPLQGFRRPWRRQYPTAMTAKGVKLHNSETQDRYANEHVSRDVC